MSVTDRPSAMRYGMNAQDVFAQATGYFTDHTLWSALQIHDVEEAFDRLIATLTGAEKVGSSRSYSLFGSTGPVAEGGKVVFSQVRTELGDLGARLQTALRQAMERYDDVDSAARFFSACTQVFDTLVQEGQVLCAQASDEGQDYEPDLRESVASVAMTRTVCGIQTLTVDRILEVERQAVFDLRRLTSNMLPLLQSNVAAAAALEREAQSRAMAGKAGTLERMAVVGHPVLAHGKDTSTQLQELRAHLLEQFTQARNMLGIVTAGLEQSRNLVLNPAAQSESSRAVPGNPKDKRYDYEIS